jgi:hypothetical protein
MVWTAPILATATGLNQKILMGDDRIPTDEPSFTSTTVADAATVLASILALPKARRLDAVAMAIRATLDLGQLK